ncbi:hypothetical protein ABFS83_03G063900 [Erythranthe nasuta]
MFYSLPDLPPPISFLCIIAILIVYVSCCYLVIDFISQDEEEEETTIADDRSSFLHLSVEELQEITCLYLNKDAGTSNVICVICLESLRQAEVCRVMPACRHEFHAQCIDPWLSKRPTCPTCRGPFRSMQSVRR